MVSAKVQVVCVRPINPSLIHIDSFHVVQLFFVFAEHQPFFAEVLFAVFLYGTFYQKSRPHITIIKV